MTNVFGTQSMTLRDSIGFSGRLTVALFATTDTLLVTAAQNWRTAVDAVTNAVEVGASGIMQFKATTVLYGTDAQYNPVASKLQLILLGASTGRLKRLSIPAPKLTCFLADQVTMNAADTATAALISAIQTTVVSNDEVREQFTVVDGIFVWRRRVERINAYTRNAGETGPA